MHPEEQARFRILDALKNNPELTQRQLAEDLGLSLGKTNYLLQALLEKGLVKISNFYHSNQRIKKIAYLLTPEGMSDRAQLTRRYLERKKTEYEALKLEIEKLERESETDGMPTTRAG